MSRRLSSIAVAAGLLVAVPRAQLTLEAVAERMRSAVGTAADPAAGDLELTGRLEFGSHEFSARILVRRKPFSWREELEWIAPASGGSPPAGIPRQAIRISDGEHCWSLADETGPGGPLTGWRAIALLDDSLLFRLLLDPWPALQDSWNGPARVMTAELAHPDKDEEVLVFAWPHRTGWLARVDRGSGRLTWLVDSTEATRRWYHLREWTSLGDGSRFPALIESGNGTQAGPVLRLKSLRSSQRHDDSAFPDDPLPQLGEVEDVARLLVAHAAAPGFATVVLTEGRVTGAAGTANDVGVLFDTGCRGLVAHQDLARSLGLLRIGETTTTGLAGTARGDICWIDRLSLGRATWLQRGVPSLQLPSIVEMPADRPLGFALGGPSVMDRAPVLDLHAGRLLLRRRAPDGQVRPLAEITGRPTLTLPLQPDARDMLLLEFSLGGVRSTAILDTGQGGPLRLTRTDMRRFGLPDDDRWGPRGGVGYIHDGVHGLARQDVLVQLDQDLLLGPVTLRRPWVLLMSPEPDGTTGLDVSQIGMGALASFEQVGFDPGRALLELVPSAAMVDPEDPTRAIVASAGGFAGFMLRPPDAAATARPHNLPQLFDVVEGWPAARAGLRNGDYLAEVEGVPCDGIAPMDVWSRLRLKDGRAITVTVVRESGEIVVVRVGG